MGMADALRRMHECETVDLTDDIIKALRWIQGNGGTVSYEKFILAGLTKNAEGYAVRFPEGLVKMEVPREVTDAEISLTDAGEFLLHVVDRP